MASLCLLRHPVYFAPAARIMSLTHSRSLSAKPVTVSRKFSQGGANPAGSGKWTAFHGGSTFLRAMVSLSQGAVTSRRPSRRPRCAASESWVRHSTWVSRGEEGQSSSSPPYSRIILFQSGTNSDVSGSSW